MVSERTVYTTCNCNCGGSCLLKVHVKGDVIVRIETDDGEAPQFRACLRGRSHRQVVYHRDRLLYPMKRTGERGAGNFARISWDEALDTLAREMVRVKDTYGPAAILHITGGGDIHILHHSRIWRRLLNLLGGHTRQWGWISYEGGYWAELVTYGTPLTTNTRDDLLNSRHIILWGENPATNIHNTNTTWYLVQAREKGARVVSIDPRFTPTAAIVADRWIPIRPGTDAAMLIAMAYTIIKEGLQDQRFLDKYTTGFDEYRRYVMGIEDGVPKTPAWAQEITGVPSETIASLARDYATLKPAALIGGIAPGRSSYGEQYHRAAMVLAAITGNVGLPGGGAAGLSWGGEFWGGDVPLTIPIVGEFPSGSNPVGRGVPPRPYSLRARGAEINCSAWVNCSQAADAILQGRKGGYFADYKLLFLTQSNCLNQMPNTNKWVRAMKSLEFIVSLEQFLTPTARYADIILPTCHFMERNDFTAGGATPFFGCVNQVIEPLGECKSPFEIACDLARRLGIRDFTDKDEKGWVSSIAAGYEKAFGIPGYDTYRDKGIYKMNLPEPYVAFKKQIEDPAHNPFPTPSGKIEIFSQQLADMNNPGIPPIPKYMPAREAPWSPLAKKYPLQMISTHFRRRAHAQYDNVPWLRELEEQVMLIHPHDAQPRGIKDGDSVRVFNDRGETRIKAHVTEGIMPGVVDIPEGGWFRPDKEGVDQGGCCNVLTNDVSSPAWSFCFNSVLVEVKKT